MNRETVLEQCYHARTLEEIAAAWKVRSAYLQEHPNDWEMFDVGSMLSRLEEALKIVGEAPPEPPLPVAGPVEAASGVDCSHVLMNMHPGFACPSRGDPLAGEWRVTQP